MGQEVSEHWVYVVRESLTGCIKVGKCAKQEGIADRIRSLQTGCPYAIQLVATLAPDEHPGERTLHKRLAKWRVRPSGEWFYGVYEAYAVLGVGCPASVGTHQDVLNESFKKRDENLEACKSLAETYLKKARHANDQMLERERELKEMEQSCLHRMRREISLELFRLRNDEGEWGRWKPKLCGGDNLLNSDLVRMIVEEAMNQRWCGVEFRRWLLEKAAWGTVRSVGCYPLIKEIQIQYEWYAKNDPEFLDELVQIINAAKRKARNEAVAA